MDGEGRGVQTSEHAARCPRCGVGQPAGKRFCADCGSPLGAACPTCAAPVEAGKRFCGDCGAAVATQPTPARARHGAVPATERRTCSVLFVDLVNFTHWAEARDPEVVRELLSRYFDVATAVVRRHGGVIEKFIGDAVMAVWGTPIANEEDAERAVRAALDLIEKIALLGTDAGVHGLAGRAGVVTGEVAVNLAAADQGMVAGDAVNTAARIQALASAGTVWVDALTQRLTASAIDYHDEGAHALKGKSEPEQVWRAVRVVSSVGGVQRVDGLEAPLTGRGAELRSVRELFHASADRSQPRLVVVTGPAGVGKSRLGWEFEKYIDGLADSVWWHRGRCLSYGDGLVYWALAEAVRQRLGIAEEDSGEVVAAKLCDGMERLVAAPADRDFIAPRLGRLLGVAGDGSDKDSTLTRDELFAGWRRFFEQLAAVQPVAILIEDAHHAGPDLLDFLDHLVDWARELPIFVIVFARPGIDDRRAGFGAGRNRASITLDPLDTESMEEIVDALVDAPTDARDIIVGRAQGIPLFAVETIRSLIDRDIVQPVEGRYRLVGAIGDLGVPDGLHALLAARLDVLDPVARSALSDAAVLGAAFPASAVAAVSGLDAAACATVLGELVRRELLEVSSDPLSPERGSYRFAQELLRQVAYETMSRRDRKARHLAVAAHLRQAFAGDGEEVIDAVARHYVDALAAVPDDPDAADIRERAVEALVRAGERARRTASPRRAATCFDDAATLVAQAGDAVRAATLRIEATDAAGAAGMFDLAIEWASSAAAAFVDLGDRHGQGRALVLAGQMLRRSGRLDQARAVLTEALPLLDDGPATERVRLDAYEQLGVTAIFSGADDADELTATALSLSQRPGLATERFASALITRALYLAATGQRPLARLYLREAARLAELDGEPRDAGFALLNLANLHIDDQPALGLDPARRSIEAMTATGLEFGVATAVANTALIYLGLGRWDDVEAVLSSGPHAHISEGTRDVLAARVVVSALRGDSATAAQLLAGFEGFEATDDPQDLAADAMARTVEAAARGGTDEALQHARAGLAQFANGLQFGGEFALWMWTLAARAAHELGRFDVEAEVAAVAGASDAHPARVATAMLQAELDLMRARLASVERPDDPAVDTAFVAATTAQRAHGTPYHLAQGLLDRAEFLVTVGLSQADIDRHALVEELVAEASDVAARLGCPSLARRAARVRDALAR